ncbi:hypothetical protein RQP46_001157 [Phenoliferia psychrophenolica]
MARDQDELFRAPQWSSLPHDPSEETHRAQLSRTNRLGIPVYGSSLCSLAEVSCDWRDAAIVYLNESVTSNHLSIVPLLREKLPRWPLTTHEHDALSTFDRIKHRVRRLDVKKSTEPRHRESLDPLFRIMELLDEDLPNLVEVSLDHGPVDHPHDDYGDDAGDPPSSIPESFLRYIAAHPVPRQNITSLTVAFDPIREPTRGFNANVLAGLLTALPSLAHLRVHSPIRVFSSSRDVEGVRTAFEGAKQLTSLSLRSTPSLDIPLVNFIAGLAATIEHLSFMYGNRAPLRATTDERPLFPPTTFPSLSHLHLTGSDNEYILKSFVGAPLSHLHLTFTEGNPSTLLTDPTILESFLPTLRHLRLDYNPSEPAMVDADLRQWCADASVSFHADASTVISKLDRGSEKESPALTLSEKSTELLNRAQEQIGRNVDAGDEVRAAEIEKALDGLRVLLKMQNE